MVEEEVRFLDLSGIKNFNAEGLIRFKNLEALNLSNTYFNRIDILAGIGDLKIVNLSNTPRISIGPIKDKIKRGLIVIGKDEESILDYINSQNSSYIGELKKFSSAVESMSNMCRITVCIPAFQEEGTIYRTLEAFLNQKDDLGMSLNQNIFEIDIIVNRPETMPKDNTVEEIKRFIKEYKNRLKVIFIEKVFKKDEACVGLARKYINDLALLRSLNRKHPEGSLILVSNDADTLEVSNKYIINIIKEFDNDSFVPYIDALAGKEDFPIEAYIRVPLLLVSTRLTQFSDTVWRHKQDTPIDFRGAKLIGRNSAVRATTYAIIEGYNPRRVVREDLEIGRKIINLRRGGETIKYSTICKLTSDPRRPLNKLMESGIGVGQYEDFGSNMEVRKRDWKELANKLSRSIDQLRIDEIEKEANSYFSGIFYEYFWPEYDRDEGVMQARVNRSISDEERKKITDNAYWRIIKSEKGKWCLEKSKTVITRVLNWLGIRFEFVNSNEAIGTKIKITDISRLKENLIRKFEEA